VANANYAAASLTQTTLAQLATPTVTLNSAPAAAAYSSTLNVAATTNAGVMPTITPTGVCSVGPVSGTPTNATASVLMTGGTGTCLLTANWPATSVYAAASAAKSITATKIASTTAITSHTPSPSVVGQPVAVRVGVTGAGLAGPTGSVTVTGNGSSCTIAVLSAGTGSCSLTLSTAGAQTLTATYAGDANFNASTSASVSQSVGDFSIGVSPASRTSNGNQSASYTLTLTPLSGFTGSVALGCASTPPLPAGYTCTFSRTPVTPGATTENVTVTVTPVRGFPGTYNLNFTGSYQNGLLAHSAAAGLTVTRKQ
jgi:hypothetical protein